MSVEKDHVYCYSCANICNDLSKTNCPHCNAPLNEERGEYV